MRLPEPNTICISEFFCRRELAMASRLQRDQADTDGQAFFQLQKPGPMEGLFVLLDAGDDDGDGLPNGYECFFTYNGNYTSCDNGDSDDDGLRDGWEVEYGLDPTGHGNRQRSSL